MASAAGDDQVGSPTATARRPLHELADPNLPAWLHDEMQACVDRTVPIVPDLR